MYRLTNIAAEVGKGFLYHNHSTNQSPTSCGLAIEPHIGPIQLKLFESFNITDEMFEKNEKYFNELISNRIIEAKQITVDRSVEEVIVRKEVEITLDLESEIVPTEIAPEPTQIITEEVIDAPVEEEELKLEIVAPKKPSVLVKKKVK